MSWTVDDYLDVEENDLEWFESNPDRILRRRPAFPLEREALNEHPLVQRGVAPSPDRSETLWALVLREAPITRLYYTDPEDFYDYGEPAVNDDFTLMMMWDKLHRKGSLAGALKLDCSCDRADLFLLHTIRIDLRYLQGFKADLNDYRKHQRKTLTLQ